MPPPNWPCLPHGLHSPAWRGSSTALVRIFHFHLWTRLGCKCQQILSTICLDSYNLQLFHFFLASSQGKTTHPQQFFRQLHLPAWPRNRLPPTRMVRMPSSQPGITCPVPTANSNGSPSESHRSMGHVSSSSWWIPVQWVLKFVDS